MLLRQAYLNVMIVNAIKTNTLNTTITEIKDLIQPGDFKKDFMFQIRNVNARQNTQEVSMVSLAA
jgi:hypothetical protein